MLPPVEPSSLPSHFQLELPSRAETRPKPSSTLGMITEQTQKTWTAAERTRDHIAWSPHLELPSPVLSRFSLSSHTLHSSQRRARGGTRSLPTGWLGPAHPSSGSRNRAYPNPASMDLTRSVAFRAGAVSHRVLAAPQASGQHSPHACRQHACRPHVCRCYFS